MRGNIFDFKVSLYKVERLISNFQRERVMEPSYIIMNRDTLDMYKTSGGCIGSSSSYGTLYGIPIAVSDMLKIGEVDIV